MKIATWQIWIADLDPKVGYEQGGTRPVVIVSSRWRNAFASDTVLTLPITTRDRGLDHHVRVTSAESGLRYPSWVRVEDIATTSMLHFRSSGALGQLSGAEVGNVRWWLREMFDIKEI